LLDLSRLVSLVGSVGSRYGGTHLIIVMINAFAFQVKIFVTAVSTKFGSVKEKKK